MSEFFCSELSCVLRLKTTAKRRGENEGVRLVYCIASPYIEVKTGGYNGKSGIRIRLSGKRFGKDSASDAWKNRKGD